MKRIQSILLTAVVLASSVLPAPLMKAEDFEEDVEIVGEEEVADGVDNSDLDSPLAGARRNKDKSKEDADLIEEFVEWSVEDGTTLEEFQAAEAQEEARIEAEEQAREREQAEKLRALLQEAGLVLESADPDRMQDYLPSLLAVDDPTGSDGELEIGASIRATMAGFGYTVSEQDFHEGFLNADFDDAPGINIIAERGADSEFRTKEIILICCHYDSVTAPEEDELLKNDKSGAAVLLECARILSDADTDVDLCFLFLSGEEDGGYGSLRFAEHLEEDLKQRVRAVIYVGPVGYMYREPAQGNGAGEDGAAGDGGMAEEESAADEENAAGEDGLTEKEQQEKKESSRNTLYGRVPYLIGADTSQGNETALYFQSLARYGKEQTQEAGLIAGTEEMTVIKEAEEAEGPEGSETTGKGETGEYEDDGSTAAFQDPEERAGLPEDWTIVEDTIGSRQYFADQGLEAVRIFQDVFREERQTLDGRAVLERRLRTQVVGEYVAETEAEEAAAAAGQGEAGESAKEEAGESAQEGTAADQERPLYPVRLDVSQLCSFTDLLAGMVSLYMISNL